MLTFLLFGMWPLRVTNFEYAETAKKKDLVPYIELDSDRYLL